MPTFPMIGKPGHPFRDLAIIVLLLAILFLPGCEHRQYQAVPECIIVSPPAAQRFIEAGVDEKLVLMSNSYISASKAAAECNNRIRLVNSSNKAVDKLE